MKFDTHDYWKHDRNQDVFLKVSFTMQPGDGRGGVVLQASWMIQGTTEWWRASKSVPIWVKPDEIEHWHPYEPKGPRRLHA